MIVHEIYNGDTWLLNTQKEQIAFCRFLVLGYLNYLQVEYGLAHTSDLEPSEDDTNLAQEIELLINVVKMSDELRAGLAKMCEKTRVGKHRYIPEKDIRTMSYIEEHKPLSEKNAAWRDMVMWFLREPTQEGAGFIEMWADVYKITMPDSYCDNDALMEIVKNFLS